MKTKKHTSEALMSVRSILVLAGVLLAVNGWAQTAETEDSAEVDVSAQQEVPDLGAALEAPDLSVAGSQGASREARQQWRAAREARRKERAEQVRLAKENAAQNQAVPPPASRPATLTGMGDVGGKQAALDIKPSPAVVSHPAAVSRAPALTGIEVSFRLDPRLTKSLYMDMGEGWVSPPISIYAGAQAGTAPTVEARVRAFDAKGLSVDISPEWIPADPEMVRVSPSQGNEVQITVQHAGQSSLKVASQRVSKNLSIMAWYQGDALQVEITEKP
jgi:hypothetical protein